jgi:signal transduction histidine kinase
LVKLCDAASVKTRKLNNSARRFTPVAIVTVAELKAIGQLADGIAHDFNNMLQAITSSLSMIRTRLQQGRISDVAGFVDRAERGAMRAANLTHRLLAFGRLQTLAPKLVSLNKIALDMEDMIRRTVGPAIEVELKLADGDWLVVCDPNQMESALLNLCINARDAMSDGGWLTISSAEVVLTVDDVADFEEAVPGRYTAISVSDTGSGMAPEVVEHVFEPFFTTKPSGQGTGLGLSQIYGFVRKSGGIIQIDTSVGKGTTIRLCLPSYGHSDNSDLASASEIGKTILLIEDEEDIREVTAEQLRDIGCRVLEADSGAAALRMIHAGAPIDLLVSDVALPGGMNGRQVAESVRGRHPGLPVILITGYSAGSR